jgi:alpha-beta hydrolase superfamily lysophospholipase
VTLSPDTDFWSAPDGTRFRRMRWRAESAPRARVIALHGLSCRSEDFSPLAERFGERGILVEAWDLRGQGLDPDPTRRGAWLEIDGMLADLAAFAGEPTELPLFLAGDSMGALLAIQAAARPEWRSRLAGLMLFVPVVALARENPRWVKPTLRFLSAILPGLRLKPSWFVQGSGEMPVLTRIPERQHELATAPHRLGPLTFSFLANMGDLIETAPPAASKIRTPTALFSAGHDVFITEAQQCAFFADIAAPDKMHFHYPEAFHQLLFDLDAEQVLADATAWIEARLPTTPSLRSAARICRSRRGGES